VGFSTEVHFWWGVGGIKRLLYVVGGVLFVGKRKVNSEKRKVKNVVEPKQ
jgi:hypothetical protein